MSGMKNHFDNYMDMILSSGESNDDYSSAFDDFDDVEEDEKLNVCREIFSAKYDLEDDEVSNDSWRDKYDGDIAILSSRYGQTMSKKEIGIQISARKWRSYQLRLESR